MKWNAAQPPVLPRRVTPRRALTVGAILTLVIHLGVLVVLRMSETPDDVDDLSAEAFVIETELLRWGEVEPDEDSLPSIANPRPGEGERPEEETLPEETREAETETVDLNPEPKDAGDETQSERRPKEIEQDDKLPQASDRGETNPHRPTNDLPIEGFGDGYRSGTSLSPSAQRNMLARIQEQLQGAFSPPRSLSDEQLHGLSVRFHVRIAKDGQVLGWEVLESSGNRQFDTAASMTLNRFKNGTSRLDMDSISDTNFRSLVEAKGLPIVMIGQ